MRILHDTATWADAIAALPTAGVLPCRTVIVFSERVAHALRRELLTTGRPEALAGTRFVTPFAAAIEVLQAAGLRFRLDDADLRASRIGRTFRRPLALTHFRRELLLGTGGWDEAFARTLRDLEGAALCPDDLRFPSATPQLLDVATVWETLDALAGDAWTGARVVAEAAGLVTRDPSAWPFDGPTLATLAPAFSAGEARFARSIPGAHLAFFAARPLRASHLDRVTRLLGPDAADALRATPLDAAASAAAAGDAATERDILAAHLFETPEALARPDRPRSRGPDGTVHFEEHAGVEAELEAAADWVGRQVLEHRTPLDRIAVLVPALDPLAGLLAQRIERLGGQPPLPVFVAGGLPASASAAGARALAVLGALRDHLPVEAVAELLPALRPATEEARHLSRGRAYTLAYALGTPGGHAADPRGALAWPVRLAARAEQLERAVAVRRGPGVAPRPEDAREVRDLEGLLADLRAVQPALEALSAIAGRALDGAALSEIGPMFQGFLSRWVLLPGLAAGGGAPLPSLLGAALEEAWADAELGAIAGADALALLDEAVRSIRVHEARYGDPAVYVGTIQGAIGLPFEAVRIIGLAEGHWPSVGREDPVLPEALRSAVPREGLRSASDHALAQLHALAAVIRGTRRAVVLSMSRVDVDRSQREPSSIFLEAAAALGRPAPQGELGGVVPNLRVLRRDGFAPARRWAEGFRKQWPLSQAGWQSVVARHGTAPPASWSGARVLDLAAIRAALEHGVVAPEDGLLGAGFELDLPGLGPERPISASGLRDLLQCPHRFLLQRVLGWGEPDSASPKREIDPMSYGSLFHEVAESFFREHGKAFSERRRSLDAWRAEADAGAERGLASFLESYPLLGGAAREQQLARLRGDLRRFLEAEWNAALPVRFFAAEHAFGYDAPAPLQAGTATVFVRGYIDRVDLEGDRLLVRDLKTGRAHPRRGREADPVPSLDVQIGVYALVARPMAKARGARLGAAYVYTGHHPDRERAFREDFAALEAATTGWLKVAEGLLRQRAFPRTPDPDDCHFCPFTPVCGDGFHDAVAGMLEEKSRGPLRALRVLKLGEEA